MTETSALTRRLQAWTYRRQRLHRAAGSPLEALEAVVGVYSSHPTAPLSLLARSAAFGPDSLAELEQRRKAIRIPAMRLSVFLVPTASAARVFAATRQPIEKRGRNLAYAGLSWEHYAALKPRILELAREPISTADLQEALKIDGRLMTAVRFLGYEGLIQRLGTSLRADRLRYVGIEAWLGQPLEEMDPAASLAWLAEQYLRGFGPARAADFAWWSGVTLGKARSALKGLDLVDVGQGHLLPADEWDAFERVEPIEPDQLDLLPTWDAYTMGHAMDGRQRFLDDEHRGKAYTSGGRSTSGDGLPLVLRSGRAVATWAHRFSGDRMRVEVAPFEPGDLEVEALRPSFEEIGRLLGATAVDVAAR
ncbi:MAG: winged helix DNA-binding domain-containing protein [Chloroflexi bacterium]|nr:winged helix DNA-binding domain-containing protein [Chloroflexota bacterium]